MQCRVQCNIWSNGEIKTHCFPWIIHYVQDWPSFHPFWLQSLSKLGHQVHRQSCGRIPCVGSLICYMLSRCACTRIMFYLDYGLPQSILMHRPYSVMCHREDSKGSWKGKMCPRLVFSTALDSRTRVLKVYPVTFLTSALNQSTQVTQGSVLHLQVESLPR
jgi:hypothetical protein